MPAPTPLLATRAAVVATGTTAALLTLLPATPPPPAPAAVVAAVRAGPIGDPAGGSPSVPVANGRAAAGSPAVQSFPAGSAAVRPHPAPQRMTTVAPFEAAVRALGAPHSATAPAAPAAAPNPAVPPVPGAAPQPDPAAPLVVDGAATAAPRWLGATPQHRPAAPSAPAAAPAAPAAAPAKPPAPANPIAPAAGRRGSAMASAMSRLGAAYRWGATGPNAFDCSGLVLWAYRQVGITLPRTSAAQSQVGTPVARSALQPGDLVFFYRPVSHVAIYIGNGRVVHASTSGQPVKISELSTMPFATARRI